MPVSNGEEGLHNNCKSYVGVTRIVYPRELLICNLTSDSQRKIFH